MQVASPEIQTYLRDGVGAPVADGAGVLDPDQQPMVPCWTATVRATNLGLLQVAIALGGGRIIQSRPDGAGSVELVYLMRPDSA